MSAGEGEGGERREGIEVGGGGNGYCGYHGYCRYRYRFVTGHKIVTRMHTRAGKGVIPAADYLYPCSSLAVSSIYPPHPGHPGSPCSLDILRSSERLKRLKVESSEQSDNSERESLLES